MIAIDTNVLLRYLLQDDPVQSQKATKILNSRQKILITDVVLVETIWTLKGKRYNLAKQDLMSVIEQLFQEPMVMFEDGQTVWKALHEYGTAMAANKVDFADMLILAKAQYNIHIKSEPFNGLYTFDADLQAFDNARKP